MAKLRLHAAAAIVAVASAVAFSGGAQGQQAVYNYFARTPDSEKVLQSNEHHHLYKGKAYLASRKPAELAYAKAEFDFILAYWPNHLPVLDLQAQTLMLLGQGGEIDEYFARAYRVSPSVAQLHVLHGVVLTRQNRLDEAIQRLEHAVSLSETSMNAHYYLGMALLAAKRPADANRHAQRAYELGHQQTELRKQLEAAHAWAPLPASGSDTKAVKNADAPAAQ